MIRKTIILVLLLLSINSVSAKEIIPRTVVINGDLDFSVINRSSKTGRNKTASTGITMQSSMQYHITQMLLVGMIFQYSTREINENDTTVNVTNKLIGPSLGINLGIS